MTSSLTPLLAQREALSAELAEVIDQQVKAQSGLSGTAVKGAYAAARKFKPNVVVNATDHMLPDFLDALAPLWDSRGGQPFGPYLAANADTAGEALLAVTDRQAESAPKPLAKAYSGLRGKAKGYVTEALEPVGEAIAKYAPAP